MAVENLKRLWKNEYFQTAITVALIIIVVFGFYFAAQTALGTPYPALAVASGSMLPTLNIGDLIIVQKIDPPQINADPNGLTGDILVYKRGNELIVHRAVKIELRGDVYYITTRGDNSGIDDPAWPSTSLVGKVIVRIPYVGNLPLFLHSERNMYMAFLIFLIIIVILMLPFGSQGEEKPTQGEQPVEKEKPSIKIDLNLIFYILLNVIIVGFMIFSLWGSFTFWQPGATPPQATIRGLFSDLQFHEKFSSNVYLSQGFLTYKIDWEVNNGIRLGVPTFSWFQISIIILVVFNAWKLYSYIKAWKSGIQAKNV
ncbi:MAG: signal peptidase I [Candidatus Bathycorpusculaceae bacterium]